MSSRGQVADGPIWPLHWAFSSALERRAFDPQAAQAEPGSMAPASPSSADATAGLPRSRLSFTCLFSSEDPQAERIAPMIQRQLFDVGVDMSSSREQPCRSFVGGCRPENSKPF